MSDEQVPPGEDSGEVGHPAAGSAREGMFQFQFLLSQLPTGKTGDPTDKTLKNERL